MSQHAPSDTDEMPLIEVSGVSKKFCRTMHRSLFYAVKDLGREISGRSVVPELRKDEFWSLQDISFSLRRGQAIGIIGSNGAGKSTLLKVIAGIIKPTRGYVRTRGRVQALIELGVGMNTMLSGRENVYVRAMLQGLNKADIDAKIDQIIEFADLGEFIDMPVRNYSSGMRVRLGFSIAIHVEPDILILDEVLAVGDQKFRAKAREAMELLLSRNVALVFISHNLSQVTSITDNTLWIEKGTEREFGPSEQICLEYIKHHSKTLGKNRHYPVSWNDLGYIDLESLVLEGGRDILNGVETIKADSEEKSLSLRLLLKSSIAINARDYLFMVVLFDENGESISYNVFNDNISAEVNGTFSRQLDIDFSDVLPGRYCVGMRMYPRDFFNGYDFASDCVFKLEMLSFEDGTAEQKVGETNYSKMNIKSDGNIMLPAAYSQ